MLFHGQIVHIDDDCAAFKNAHGRTIDVGVVDLEFASIAFSAMLLEPLEHTINGISHRGKKFL